MMTEAARLKTVRDEAERIADRLGAAACDWIAHR